MPVRRSVRYPVPHPVRYLAAVPLILGLLAAGCKGDVTPEATPEALPAIQEVWITEAREQADRLGGALQQTLRDTIMAQGVEAGIDVCHVQAPEIAARLSAEGWEVGRTALRLRHPDNAPTAWQREQLLVMQEAPMQAGRPVEAMRVVDHAGGPVFEYLRAIPMQETCMACHGPAIDESVLQTIARQYPDDEATGFVPGDLRGAFVIRRALE